MAVKSYVWIMLMHVVLVLSKDSVNTEKAEAIENIKNQITELQNDLQDMKVSLGEHESDERLKISELKNSLLEQRIEMGQQKINISYLENLIMERDLQKCTFENQLLKLESNLRQHFEDRIHGLYLKLEEANKNMDVLSRELGTWVLKTQQLDDMLNETSQVTENTENQKKIEKIQKQIDLIVENVTRKNAEQKRQLDILKHEKLNSTKSSNLAGATYIRWGRTTCLGNETELVYTGQAAGSHYDHPGGAVNHLCLPNNPEWGSFKTGTSHHAYIYGSEIATDGQNIPGSTVDRKYQGHDVFCAVCRSKTRTSFLMVPGRNVCDNGWNLEYNGYLMAGRYNHQAATEYICMDSKPETVPGEKGYSWKNILYSVEAQCDPLRCPPYVNGMEMTCAVCTK